MATQRKSLTGFAWLSALAAVTTIALKVSAYWVTGSIGLLADAIESGVNLLTALLVLILLKVAEQPPDSKHPYGHEKAEYFSSGIEGVLIAGTAVGIAVLAVQRIIEPVPIERLDIGIILAVVASLVNFIVARVLAKAGQLYGSIPLEADAQHLMTDVWTSVSVVVAVGLVWMTEWYVLDPAVALIVSAHIAWVGSRLVYRSIQGLMDRALPADQVHVIRKILDEYRPRGVRYHALRTRQSGIRKFVSFHVQVPGKWTVKEGHDLVEEIEWKVREALFPVTVFAHLEPIEDPVSWHDEELDRPGRKSEEKATRA